MVCPARLVLPSACSSSGTRLPHPRPGRRPGPGQPLQTGRCAAGRRQPLSTPERCWGASGGGAGRPGRLPGGGGWQRREAWRAPGASRPDSVPAVQGHQQGLPGERRVRDGRSAEGGEGHLPSLAGCPGTQLDFLHAVSPPRGRGHSEGSWLPAASMLGAGELGGPTSGVPSGLACRMPTLRAAEKASGVCVCEDPGLPRAPRVGSCYPAGPRGSPACSLSLLAPPRGSSQGLGLCWPVLSHDLRPGWLCVRDQHSPRHM